MIELLRWVAPPILAGAAAWWVDRRMESRGMLPALFRPPPGAVGLAAWNPRRAVAALLLALVFWLTVFAAIGLLGTTGDREFVAPATPQLFVVHAILVSALAAWFVLGYIRMEQGRIEWVASPVRQFGLRAASMTSELGLGVLCGVAAWVVVISLLLALGLLVWMLGGDDALPQQAPPIVPWIAALPLAVRLAISASAGLAEELFFRGFLQPRVGIGLSTALFALAHLSYDQPIMLVGVTLLSLAFAFIVRWRQSIWAAVVAHAVFDAIQLTLVIPRALQFLDTGGAEFIAVGVW